MHFIADETVLFNNDSALLPLGLFLEAESYFSGCWVVQGDDMGGEILVAAGADHDMVVEPTSGPDDTMGYSGGGSGWLRSRPDLGDWNLTFPFTLDGSIERFESETCQDTETCDGHDCIDIQSSVYELKDDNIMYMNMSMCTNDMQNMSMSISMFPIRRRRRMSDGDSFMKTESMSTWMPIDFHDEPWSSMGLNELQDDFYDWLGDIVQDFVDDVDPAPTPLPSPFPTALHTTPAPTVSPSASPSARPSVSPAVNCGAGEYYNAEANTWYNLTGSRHHR